MLQERLGNPRNRLAPDS